MISFNVVHMGIRICQYQIRICTISSIPVHYFDIRFRQYWRRYIFNCLIFYFCTYLLTNFSVGQTHKRLVHERVRNFACNFCDYRTVNNSQLANHIRYVQTYQLAIPARIIEEERDGG